MLRLFTATALCGTLLLSITPASAAKLGCNPAVQNWQNGSGTTCPFDSNGSASPAVVVPTEAPAPVTVTPEPSPEPSPESVEF